jgi:hypothetical protein
LIYRGTDQLTTAVNSQSAASALHQIHDVAQLPNLWRTAEGRGFPTLDVSGPQWSVDFRRWSARFQVAV